jgi:drug/metabolite transporter superfamily protein YnfA
MAAGSNLRLIWGFLRARKKWWLTPFILVLLLFGVLMVFAQSSALAPFIYAIF